MRRFSTPEIGKQKSSSAESPELGEQEKVIEEAKAFFEERAQEAVNPDTKNKYVGGPKRFEGLMRAYIRNIEGGRFFDDVNFSAELRQKLLWGIFWALSPGVDGRENRSGPFAKAKFNKF